MFTVSLSSLDCSQDFLCSSETNPLWPSTMWQSPPRAGCAVSHCLLHPLICDHYKLMCSWDEKPSRHPLNGLLSCCQHKLKWSYWSGLNNRLLRRWELKLDSNQDTIMSIMVTTGCWELRMALSLLKATHMKDPERSGKTNDRAWGLWTPQAKARVTAVPTSTVTGYRRTTDCVRINYMSTDISAAFKIQFDYQRMLLSFC